MNNIVHEQEEENGLNKTIYENYTESESLKIENNLLKQLLKETQDKNELLNELLIKERQNNNFKNIKPHTFAEILTNTTPKNKRVPKLIIKKTNNKDKLNLENTVLHYLAKDKTIQTKNVTKINNDTIIINCMNEGSINTIEKTLCKKLTISAKIEKEQIKKPIVKIINIEKVFNEKELEQDINQRNFNNIDDKCKVLHINSREKSKTMSSIIEVTPTIYKHIRDNKSNLFIGFQNSRDNKNNLFIGFQNCRVFDIVNTNPCPKCSRFGHSGKKCKNEAKCYKCAGNHAAAECNYDILKCTNCEFNNNKFKTSHNVNHSAIDSDQCEILKNKIKRFIDMTDYPLQPTYRRYFDNIETGEKDNSRSQQWITIRRVRLVSNASVGTLSPSTPTSIVQPIIYTKENEY